MPALKEREPEWDSFPPEMRNANGTNTQTWD
jgi:hypothetical protein